MKRYRFRLAAVLRVRRIEEEKAVLALAGARSGAEQAAAAEHAAETRYANAPASEGPMNTATYLTKRALTEAAAKSVVTARQRRVEAELVLDGARQGWVEAKGRVTGLERLDERRREEHWQASLRAEASAADELVMARHARAIEEDSE